MPRKRSWVTGILVCTLTVMAAGCASTRNTQTGLGPEDVLDKDLPPAEKPPIEIRARTERDPRGGYRYVYTISNGTPYRITDFQIGLDARDGRNAIRTPPSEGYDAPSGWRLQYDRSGSRGRLVWSGSEHEAIHPGETLGGFGVRVPSGDGKYERSLWVAYVTGEPGTFTGSLERGESPWDDPIERLGRLHVSPRVSRGDVIIHYRTPNKARPIVFILDPECKVIRKYPQDKSGRRDREVVWDRMDAAGQQAPPGDYFVRVRYGFTERFARVTLVP